MCAFLVGDLISRLLGFHTLLVGSALLAMRGLSSSRWLSMRHNENSIDEVSDAFVNEVIDHPRMDILLHILRVQTQIVIPLFSMAMLLNYILQRNNSIICLLMK